MAELSCATCRWHDVTGFQRYYAEVAAEMPRRGFCRRYPPLPALT